MNTDDESIGDAPGDKLTASLHRVYIQSVIEYITDKLRDHITSYKSKNIVLDVSCAQSKDVSVISFLQRSRYDIMFNASYKCCGATYRDTIVSMTVIKPTDGNSICMLSLDSSNVSYDIINEAELVRVTDDIIHMFDVWRYEYNWYNKLYYAMMNNNDIRINNIIPVSLRYGAASKAFNIAIRCYGSGKFVQCSIVAAGPCSHDNDTIFNICIRVFQIDANSDNNNCLTSDDVCKISDNFDISSVRPATLLKQMVKKVNEVINNRMLRLHSHSTKNINARRLANKVSLFR